MYISCDTLQTYKVLAFYGKVINGGECKINIAQSQDVYRGYGGGDDTHYIDTEKNNASGSDVAIFIMVYFDTGFFIC